MPSAKSAPSAIANYLPLRTVRLRDAVPLSRAISEAPSLSDLASAALRSAHCLQLVTPLIAPAMRPAVKAGSLQDGQWCLLASNSAVAAKLRQLSPALLAHLRTQGQAVEDIQIKITLRNA